MSNDSAQLLQALMDAPAEQASAKKRLDLYKFYQERIETIRTRLWTTLTWLAAAQGALLIFAFEQGEIRSVPGPELLIGQPMLVFFLAVLGMFIARYTLEVVEDGTHHIPSNWRSSDLTLGRQTGASSLSKTEWRRTFPAFAAMKTLGKLAFIPLSLMLVAALLGMAEWLAWDLPGLRLQAEDSPGDAPTPTPQ